MGEMELIAVRIKDGIFAGNVAAAEDREFLGMNKITHVVNCAGGEVADFFAGDSELRYLSFPWKDVAGSVCTTVLFDASDENISKAVQFIDEAMAAGECVLVHSYNGVSRSPALIAAYFIVKYGWKLESAVSFLQMAHPDVSIKPHFLRQLRLFAKRHQVDCDIFDRNVDERDFGLDNDQWMLRNTLLNGLTHAEQETNDLYHACVAKVDVGLRVSKDGKRARLSFVDTKQGTSVDATSSTPVVPGRTPAAGHADPTRTTGSLHGEDSFIGAQGPLALRSGRRSPSIISRTTSPCSRPLESDPKSNPKGRQELKPAVMEKPAVNATTLAKSATAGNQLTRTAMEESKRAEVSRNGDGEKPTSGREASMESNQGRTSYYERLAPPRPKTASGSNLPARSPLATLTSKHKYRNGSPLPLSKDKQKTQRADRAKVASTPSSRPSSAAGSPTSPRAPRSTSASSRDRTGSPGTATHSGRSKGASGVTREANSRYVAIAPQRSRSATGRPAWNAPAASPAHEKPTATRPLSPAYKPSTPSRGGRQRSNSVRSQTSSQGDREKSRRRSISKSKKRTGSPGKATPTPPKRPASPLSQSTLTTPLAERTVSPGKRVNGSSPSQSKLRRAPPAAISSRRQ